MQAMTGLRELPTNTCLSSHDGPAPRTGLTCWPAPDSRLSCWPFCKCHMSQALREPSYERIQLVFQSECEHEYRCTG